MIMRELALCLPFVVVLICRPLVGMLLMDHHVTIVCVCVSFVHGKGFTQDTTKQKQKQKQSNEGKANDKKVMTHYVLWSILL